MSPRTSLSGALASVRAIARSNLADRPAAVRVRKARGQEGFMPSRLAGANRAGAEERSRAVCSLFAWWLLVVDYSRCGGGDGSETAAAFSQKEAENERASSAHCKWEGPIRRQGRCSDTE